MSKTKFGLSVQSPAQQGTTFFQAAEEISSSPFNWTVVGDYEHIPPYGSSSRDAYLVNHLTKYGNDLLSGAVSQLQSKIVTTHWFVEGPLALAQAVRDMLLYRSDFGLGWESMVAPWIHGYLCRDGGGVLENFRTSREDHDGPSMGFAHLDEDKLQPTGNPERPFTYQARDGQIEMYRSQVSPIIDMRDGRDRMLGRGYCALSRTLATSHLLMDIVTYKREMLSAMPPAGILFINNMTENQWKDLNQKYDTRQHDSGNKVWRDIMVACGIDPAYPVSAEMFQMRQLWESFDERTQMEMAVYSFALGFRVDPREYWPVSSGSLGTATEAEIQHRKARAKGEGAIFSAVERVFNGPYGIGPLLRFRFDFRDDDEDQQAAEIAKLKIDNIRKMWEASPNAYYHQLKEEPEEAEQEVGVEQEEDEDEQEPMKQAPEVGEDVSDIVGIGGMISTEEARALLVDWNIIEPHILGQQIEEGRVYDVKALTKAYGPWARVYSDGRIRATRTS